MALHQTHFGDFLHLTVVEFAEDGSLHIVDVLDAHALTLFSDLDSFEQSVVPSGFAVLLDVALKHSLDVFGPYLAGVNQFGNCIVVGKLCLQCLAVEKGWKLHDDLVGE